jgi:16S rRNA A1518/A1519 N6-dimethyltransferase RsmA/KsgA/DIM1 with predicted DNA glycosylase/AP lyase activity
VDQQKEMGFFETPEPLARKMLIYANLLERDIVLELSAGRGAIIRVLPSSQRVHAVEIDPDHVDVLLDLQDTYPRLQVHEGDFLRRIIGRRSALSTR